MKIVLLSSPFIPVPPNKYGGTERVVDALIKGLLEKGHEVTLLAPGDSRVDCRLVPTIDKSLEFKINPSSPERKELVEQTEEFIQNWLQTNIQNVDIIHSFGPDLNGFEHFPNLTSLECPITNDSFTYFNTRKKLNYVTVSADQMKTTQNLNVIDFVYNGLLTEGFPLVEKPENYICFLGRFDEDKQPHLAIELALRTQTPIIIAGKIDFAGKQYFEKHIKPYLDHPLVTYVGELGFTEKVDLISKAKCNLHPIGFREPFGLTIAEAAFCGTPTLAIRKGSMEEVIEDGKTGYLCDDFIEGTFYLEKCFELDRKYIAERSRKLFNHQVMTKKYLQLYSRLLNS